MPGLGLHTILHLFRHVPSKPAVHLVLTPLQTPPVRLQHGEECLVCGMFRPLGAPVLVPACSTLPDPAICRLRTLLGATQEVER